MPGDNEGAAGWSLDAHADTAARAHLRTQLKLFNDAYVRRDVEARQLEPEPNPLELVLRDDDGRIRGGLLGYTHWGWLHVQTLWVAEGCRGQGCGRRILDSAEALARSRGCHHSRLGTYDFQAKDFYRRLGYTVWGQLPDYPPGHSSFAMVKQLDDPQLA
jgi:ribosomal protein S18 acetylase RimI-like enzyme